ncbi:MAG: FHA domain-containing protein [Acidimicrobiales bacterium]
MLVYLAVVPGPNGNAPVLRALEFGVILLLWLFFLWVVRAVWVEVRPVNRRRRSDKDEAVDTGVGGTARRSRRLRLAVVKPDDRAGRTFEIGTEVTVGRAAGCGVAIDYDTFASSLHARLFRLDGDVWVEDLGSTNGTWVNTERIAERTRIEKGDLLQVGGTVFEVVK